MKGVQSHSRSAPPHRVQGNGHLRSWKTGAFAAVKFRFCQTLALCLLLAGCGSDDPVLTGGPGPRVDVVGDEFHVTFERRDAGRLRTRIDRDGRFLARDEPAGEPAGNAAEDRPGPWRVVARPLGEDLANLFWQKPEAEPRVIGRVAVVDGKAAHSRVVQTQGLQFVAWVERVPAVQRLMLSGIDPSGNEEIRDILKDGVPVDCAPSIAAMGPQLLLAYVRRGRLRTKLVRLPAVWFEKETP